MAMLEQLIKSVLRLSAAREVKRLARRVRLFFLSVIAILFLTLVCLIIIASYFLIHLVQGR